MFPDVFLANFAAHADFAKASKFSVLIFQPPGLVAGGLFGGLIGQSKITQRIGGALNTLGLAFQCDQAILPGYNINTVEQQIFGAPFSIAANPETPQPLELSFICAGDLWERKFFEDWMEFIMPKGFKRSTGDYISQRPINPNVVPVGVDSGSLTLPAGTAQYRDTYISTIQVISLHETGVPSARYSFEECYPVSVSPTQLNWGDDGIQRITVTFKYKNWTREKNILKQLAEKLDIVIPPIED